MNNELRENQINQDYYLKRAIIFSLIAVSSPYPAYVVGLIAVSMEKDNSQKTPAFVIFSGFLLLIWFLFFMSPAIYYTTKSWKAYKACQEENNQ